MSLVCLVGISQNTRKHCLVFKKGRKQVRLTKTFFFSTVDAGHRAVIFDRFRGVQDEVVGEGTHFLIPWVQKPIVFDCRSRPRNVPVITGSKGTLLLNCCSFVFCVDLFHSNQYIIRMF